VTHLASKDGLKYDLNEEVASGSIITHEGRLLNPLTKKILNLE
jgi:hypothetical protein